jgi:adenosine kinase
MDWRSTGQLASLMGALKIGSRGGQNHRATRAEIETLYRQRFDAQLG